MAHRAAPISVSIALGHASANAVKATAGGWSTDGSASLTFPLQPTGFEADAYYWFSNFQIITQSIDA